MGFDSIGYELVQRLTKRASRHSVILIVGTSGIGKTTLAKKVYKDKVVRGRLDCHARITISQYMI